MAQDPAVEIGSRLAFFVDPQAANSFGTAAGNSPVAADAVRVVDANLSGKSPFRFRRDMRGTSTRLGSIAQKRTAEWSADLVAYLSGAAGTAPDWADLLLNQLQAVTGTDTTIVGATSTTTVLAVTSAAGFTAGGCVLVSGELRRITAVDVIAAPDTITVTPALSAIPVATTPVVAGISYFPDDDAANAQRALTLWRANNRTADRVIGAIVQSMRIQMGRDEEASATFSGPARRHDRMIATQLNGAINNAVTSIPVDNGLSVPQDISAAAPVYVQVDDEVMEVIAVVGNTLTVSARGVYLGGGAAAAHDDNDVMYPYQPTPTLTDTPVPSTAGEIIIDGVTVQMTEFDLEIAHNLAERRGEHGDGWDLNGYDPKNAARDCKFSATGFLYNPATTDRLLDAHQRTAVQVFCQQGDTAGAVFAVELPEVRLEESDIAGGQEQITVSLTGSGERSTAEGEFFLMIA